MRINKYIRKNRKLHNQIKKFKINQKLRDDLNLRIITSEKINKKYRNFNILLTNKRKSNKILNQGRFNHELIKEEIKYKKMMKGYFSKENDNLNKILMLLQKKTICDWKQKVSYNQKVEYNQIRKEIITKKKKKQRFFNLCKIFMKEYKYLGESIPNKKKFINSQKKEWRRVVPSVVDWKLSKKAKKYLKKRKVKS